MSREAYIPPTLSQTSPSSSQTQSALLNPYDTSSASGTGIAGPLTQYLCGDCNVKVSLKKGDPIRCKECGHRVLYKERTKRMVQFEAR